MAVEHDLPTHTLEGGNLPNVMEQSGPPKLRPLRGLVDHLLDVVPQILVTHLDPTKTHHSAQLGGQCVKYPVRYQALKPALNVIRKKTLCEMGLKEGRL